MRQSEPQTKVVYIIVKSTHITLTEKLSTRSAVAREKAILPVVIFRVYPKGGRVVEVVLATVMSTYIYICHS
jgi:hypothetical protein